MLYLLVLYNYRKQISSILLFIFIWNLFFIIIPSTNKFKSDKKNQSIDLQIQEKNQDHLLNSSGFAFFEEIEEESEDILEDFSILITICLFRIDSETLFFEKLKFCTSKLKSSKKYDTLVVLFHAFRI